MGERKAIQLDVPSSTRDHSLFTESGSETLDNLFTGKRERTTGPVAVVFNHEVIHVRRGQGGIEVEPGVGLTDRPTGVVVMSGRELAARWTGRPVATRGL